MFKVFVRPGSDSWQNPVQFGPATLTSTFPAYYSSNDHTYPCSDVLLDMRLPGSRGAEPLGAEVTEVW